MYLPLRRWAAVTFWYTGNMFKLLSDNSKLSNEKTAEAGGSWRAMMAVLALISTIGACLKQVARISQRSFHKIVSADFKRITVMLKMVLFKIMRAKYWNRNTT
jgi:hypothetical protein